jgi:Cu+-exporting ATPase
VLVIRNKELIPADGLLLETHASIDYSFVTGESAPVSRKQNDLLYAGGRQVGESIKILVEKEVSQSYLTQLWNDGSFQKEKEDEHALTINVIAKYFTIVVMVLATAAFVFWWGQSAAIAINAFTAVLIVACPCALALATPFTLGNAMAILGKSGLYLKNTHIIEKMASAGRLVFDKTGTLTQAKGYDGRLDTPLEAQVLDAVYSITSHSTHPLSRKLHDHLGQGGRTQLKVEGYVETEGRGIEAKVNGQTYRIGAPAFCFYTENDLAGEGSEVFIAQNGSPLGRFVVSSQLRNGLKQVIASLGTGYRMSLLSGDRPADKGMMEGLFPVGTPMYFQQKPEDKLHYVAERQTSGETVIMLGDGLNDAGALQRADVGIAVSEDVANFSPASDGILDARSFDKLPAFLTLSRRARKVILICFGVSFAYNIVGLSFAITGMLTPLLAAVLMPVSSITIVALSTLLVRVAATQLRLK